MFASFRSTYKLILTRILPDYVVQLSWRFDVMLACLKDRPPECHSGAYKQSSLFHVTATTLQLDDLPPIYDPNDTLHGVTQHRLLDRPLFWTTEGYVSLGCHCPRQGDKVVIFDGDITPFTQRRVDSMKEMTEQDLFQPVSYCYVYGWMYGSQVEDETKTPGDSE